MAFLNKSWLVGGLALLALACGRPQGAAPFHVAIVTGTVSQSEDELRGAQALLEAYGPVQRGGMIQHQTYPDDFMSQQETFISNLLALADDPKMKAIVVNQAIPGTAEAFRRIHVRRRDILCLARLFLVLGPVAAQRAGTMAVFDPSSLPPLPPLCSDWPLCSEFSEPGLCSDCSDCSR